jgi:hypothetical protein
MDAPTPAPTPTPPPSRKWVTLSDVAKSLGGARGPDCIWCNAPTKRTGACYTCIACGSTTSC